MTEVARLIEADSKPTIKQLKKWVIPRVGHKWHNLGFELLDHVKAKRLSASKGSNQKCCLEVLRVWLDGNPDTNWYPLMEALESKSVQLNEVASDIRNMFTGTQATPDSSRNFRVAPKFLKGLQQAAQYPKKHLAEEFERTSESFCLYPLNSGINFLRKVDMIGDEHSRVLKRSIDDNLTTLNNQLESKLDKLRLDVTENQHESEQFYEDQINILKDQIKNDIHVFTGHLEGVMQRQQAVYKNMLTLFVNSQFEIRVYLLAIIITLFLILCILVYSSFKV